MKDWKRNIPNILTIIRIAFIPLVVKFIHEGEMFFGFLFFSIAMLTDVLDGWLARKYGWITKLGQWMDPLADKLMALTVLILFAVRGIIPMFVLVIILSKELLMLCGGAFLLKKGVVIPANKYGKLAALALNISLMLGFAYIILYPWYLYAIYASIVLVLVALVQYAAIAIGKLKEIKR